MMIKKSKSALLLACCLLANTVVLPALSCGPFSDSPIFTYSYNPDLPLSLYAQGNLGLLKPTFARSYLYVAYRYLTDQPLSKDEQRGVLTYLDYRLGLSNTLDSSRYPSITNSTTGGEPPVQEDLPSPALQIWEKARASAGGKDWPKDFSTFRSYRASYTNYYNCPDDAFRTATNTLKELTAKYGQGSAPVKSWLDAQDLVFCHCGDPGYQPKTYEPKPEPAFPEPLKDNQDPLLVADRNYQIAASHFYGQQFDKSFEEFSAIAKDSNSPWSQIAPYLAARTLVRKATLLQDKTDAVLLGKAKVMLEQFMQNDKNSVLKPAAQELVDFIELAIEPSKQLRMLSKRLQSKTVNEHFGQDLYDYVVAFNNTLGQGFDDCADSPNSLFASSITNQESLNKDLSETLAKVGDDELLLWTVIFQSPAPNSYKLSLDHYKKNHAPIWLISALSKADTKSAELSLLMEDAAKFDPKSKAYATVIWHRLRLLRQQGKLDEAYKITCDFINQNTAIFGPSTINNFRQLALVLSKNFPDFLKYGIDHPAGINSGWTGNELPEDLSKVEQAKSFPAVPSRLVDAAVLTINKNVPLSYWATIAKDTRLTAAQKLDILQAAYVRSVMLNNSSVVKAIAPELGKQAPYLVPHIKSIEQSKNSTEKSFNFAFMCLQNPGMKPYVEEGMGRSEPPNERDMYGDNWWDSKPATFGATPDADVPRAFLSQAELAKGQQETAALAKFGVGSNYLTGLVLAFVKTNPQDPRIPEALSRAVKSAKFGPTDENTTDWSRRAFKILHSTYAKSKWAKDTPYYY